MSYIREEVTRFVEHIKALGFTVFLAKDGTYGFITDDKRERVLSFSMRDNSLGGNYGPPSKESGTGWRMDTSPDSLRTAEDVREALYEPAPVWVGKGWRHYTTVDMHLKMYGPSSRYEEQ